jgi:hypothetical protein
MPYAIDIFDSAWDDLRELVEFIPTDRWDAITVAIVAILDQFGQAPTRGRPSDMVVPLRFVAGGVQYNWLAAWQYGHDEQTIHITAFGRDPKIRF